MSLADNNLLVLGQQLAAISIEMQEMRRWRGEIEELYNDEVEKCETSWHDQDEWTPWDAKAYCDAKQRVEEETEIGRAFVRASNAEEAVYKRLDVVCKRIKACEPRTAKERALRHWVNAMVLAEWAEARQHEEAYRGGVQS
jgi:hypothetical protein